MQVVVPIVRHVLMRQHVLLVKRDMELLQTLVLLAIINIA